MRLELGDGQWVELKERLTHGEDKTLRKALARAVSDFDDDDESVELNTTALEVFVKDWYVKDLNGEWITTHTRADIERAPSDVVDAAVAECNKIFRTIRGNQTTYGALIGRMILGQGVDDSEIAKLPDPDLFRDAVFLARNGRWSPEDLDGSDSQLIRLVRHLQRKPTSGAPN